MSDSPIYLLRELLKAETDSEVTQIILNHKILQDSQNWHPYGGQENKNNLGTINNQQQSPVAALTEKLINSVDALLIKECLLRGINPQSLSAPLSMAQAVEVFYGVPKGDFSDVMESKRRDLAKNIVLYASGLMERPSITVIDTGEGQNFADFEDTLLSLHKDNKMDIRFVQGKFNMGSTGVLRFCGENHYQLILSKKHPKLLKSSQANDWGFTLVRLRPQVGDEEKHTWYEYCTDINGEVLHFSDEELFEPDSNNYLTSGTLIKMFEYQLPPGIRSNLTLDFWRELNRYLYMPAMPMLIKDLRYTKGHVISGKVILGNKTRIMVDDKEKIEHSSIIQDVDFGSVGLLNIEYAVFKSNEIRLRDEFTTERQAVLLTVNGQTHASLPRSFIRNDVKLPYVAQTLLVQVDCTNMPTAIKDRIFMASRDRLADHPASIKFQEILARELHEDSGLQAINKLRHDKILSSNPKETKFMEEVISDLIKDNRELINLLGLGVGITDIKDPGIVPVKKFEGKKFPTYFRLIKRELKKIPCNSYIRVKFETDACNDYFLRERDYGDLYVAPPILTSKHLYNGILTAKLVCKKNSRVGERELISVRLIRPYDSPLNETINVEYMGPIETQTTPPGPPPEPQGKNYSLPKYNLVPKENWGTLGWTSEDIAEIAVLDTIQQGDKLAEKIEVNINQDPDVLLHFLRTKELSESRADVIKKRYYTSIFLYSLVTYNHFSKLNKKDVVPEIMKSISRILLNLLVSDTFLKELEKIS